MNIKKAKYIALHLIGAGYKQIVGNNINDMAELILKLSESDDYERHVDRVDALEKDMVNMIGTIYAKSADQPKITEAPKVIGYMEKQKLHPVEQTIVVEAENFMSGEFSAEGW